MNHPSVTQLLGNEEIVLVFNLVAFQIDLSEWIEFRRKKREAHGKIQQKPFSRAIGPGVGEQIEVI